MKIQYKKAILAGGCFRGAEPEHQNYLQRYPDGYTCHFPRPEWVLPQTKGNQ